MFDTLKPLLNYEYCSRCRECCIFHDPDGIWTPRVTPAEAAELVQVSGRGTSILAAPDRLKIVPAKQDSQCLFLDRSGYRCTFYDSRPVECRLYPFLLSSEDDGVHLYAHLSCPFVQEKSRTREWQDYVVGLRAFFSRADVRRYVADNRAVFPDYSAFASQLMPIFEVRASFASDLLKERVRFETLAGSRGGRISAYAFANLFVWQDSLDFYFKEIDGRLCIYAHQPVGTFLYLPPLGGDVSVSIIQKAFEILRALNRGGSLTRIENVRREECGLFDPVRYVCAEKGVEYIYLREDIAGLRGQALKSKRHDVNLVERRAPEYRRYVSSDREACLQLFDRWLDRKLSALDDDNDVLLRHMLADAKSAHAYLWDFAQPLGIEGRVVEIAGQMVAYTFGCRLNEETFCVLVEVADPDVAGLAAFIFRAFAADEVVRPYRYLNAMDDYGLPAMTRTKMSWRPKFMEPVYTVTEIGGGF